MFFGHVTLESFDRSRLNMLFDQSEVRGLYLPNFPPVWNEIYYIKLMFKQSSLSYYWSQQGPVETLSWLLSAHNVIFTSFISTLAGGVGGPVIVI